SGSSVPDRSRVGLCASNTVQAPCAPNPSRAPHRSAGLSDQEALPCRDQTHKRIGPVHHLAVPSSTAPANHRLNPTESRFAHRLNERFATQSGAKRTWLRDDAELPCDPNVWSGRALQEDFSELGDVRSCINVSGL